MKRTNRQPTPAELERITSSKPVVKRYRREATNNTKRTDSTPTTPEVPGRTQATLREER